MLVDHPKDAKPKANTVILVVKAYWYPLLLKTATIGGDISVT